MVSKPPNPLYGAQYGEYSHRSHLTVPSSSRRFYSANNSTDASLENYFHKAAKKATCKSYELHRAVRGRAVDKQAQNKYRDSRKNQDWNFIFPPSVINKQCDATAVRTILGCECKICCKFDIDLIGDDSLISEIETDSEIRFSVAVLAYMGAGFAIRCLTSYGLGQNGFSLSTQLSSSSLREKLFRPLQSSPKIPEYLDCDADRNPEEMASNFIAFYEETRRLLRSPKLQADMTTTEFQTWNLPFIDETSLDPGAPHRYPHISTFTIHPEYQDDSFPTGSLVRKRLQRAASATDESAEDEKNILKFIAKLDRRNIIKLCFWFSYENTLNLVFPRYPGTLEDVLLDRWLPSRRSQFSSKFRGYQLAHWLWEEAVDIVEAIDYIHNPGNFGGKDLILAHFDLKPANILVDDEGHMVITDFGIASMKSLTDSETTRLMGGAGTLTYAPPEANDTRMRRDRKYDIWSMGCILLEIILFVKYDKGPKISSNVVELFSKQRLAESRSREFQSQAFWIEDSKGKNVSLKDCVDKHLIALSKEDDPYTKRTEREIRKFMLNTAASSRHSARECFNILKANELSSFQMALGVHGHQTVAIGEQTESPISRMSVFFDSKEPDKLSQPSIDCELRFFLVRSHMERRNKLQVLMKYELDESKNERRDSGYEFEEDFVPISSYINPKIPGTPFQFRLTSIHPRISFKLKDERNFFRIQAALTRQQVRMPRQGSSILPIKRCWFKPKGMFGAKGSTKLKVPGCVQIWDQLSDEEYKEDIIQGERRPSNTSSNRVGSNLHSLSRAQTIPSKAQENAPKESAQANPTRIAIFLCSDPAQEQYVTLITMNMAYQTHVLGSEHICTENIPEDPGKFQSCVAFSSPNHSFDAYCFRETPDGDIAGIPINKSPGIPLDPLVLHDKERDNKLKLQWLELEFMSKEDRDNFETRVNQRRLEPYDRP